MAESAHLSWAKICIDVSCVSPDPYKESLFWMIQACKKKRATLDNKQKNETSNGETFVTETNQASWNFLTNTISHGQTILYLMISAIEAGKKAVGCSLNIFDPGKNGLQLTDDFAMTLKNEFVLDDPKVISPCVLRNASAMTAEREALRMGIERLTVFYRNKSQSGTTRRHVQEDDVEAHQGYARFSQKIEGHDSCQSYRSKACESFVRWDNGRASRRSSCW